MSKSAHGEITVRMHADNGVKSGYKYGWIIAFRDIKIIKNTALLSFDSAKKSMIKWRDLYMPNLKIKIKKGSKLIHIEVGK